MDGPFHFAFDGSWRTALGGGVVGAIQLNDVARGVLNNFVTTNDVAVTQPDFAAGLEPKEFGRRRFHEIIAFNI